MTEDLLLEASPCLRPWLLGVREGWLGHCGGYRDLGNRAGPLPSLLACFLTPGRGCSGFWNVSSAASGLAGAGERAVETQNWPYFLRVVWGPQGSPQPQPHWLEPARLWECSEPRVGGQPWFAFFWSWGVSGGSCENPVKGPVGWGLVEWGGGARAGPGLKEGC